MRKKSGQVQFGALILTHGRADTCITHKTLRDFGYTGPIRFVIDNEDSQADKYIENFGEENVIIFDKKAIAATFDEGDNFDDRRAIIYARNASFEIAKKQGWTHFIQLDDDYTDWRWIFSPEFKCRHGRIRNLDLVFEILTRFLIKTKCLTIALSQGGDLIGGQDSGNLPTVNLGVSGKRKAMNTFICDVDNPIGFVGRINEDVNAYTLLGSRGELFFATNQCRIDQKQTQTSDGGMTSIYKLSGTYVKSFYSVMYMPSAVRISMMISKYPRLHHRVSWNNCVPKILPESARKN